MRKKLKIIWSVLQSQTREAFIRSGIAVAVVVAFVLGAVLLQVLLAVAGLVTSPGAAGLGVAAGVALLVVSKSRQEQAFNMLVTGVDRWRSRWVASQEDDEYECGAEDDYEDDYVCEHPGEHAAIFVVVACTLFGLGVFLALLSPPGSIVFCAGIAAVAAAFAVIQMYEVPKPESGDGE